MAILEAINVEKDFGGEALFSGASFGVEAGEKLGLVGRNGSGKTTLLRILAGLDEDYRGALRLEPHARIAYVSQKPPEPSPGESALDFVCRDAYAERAELERLAEAMGESDPSAAAAAARAYGELRERYDASGGDLAEEAARRLLERMGLGGQADTELASLSGGELNALALARAMQGRPSLLILDEPGNHLDLAGLAWLEDYLAGLPCAVLMVSHDRRLLDRVCTAILELEGRAITRYAGNYSEYRLRRLRDAAGQGQRWQADRRKIERLEALVKKFEQIARARPDPAWGKRLRARRSQLEREKEQATERPDLGRRDAAVSFLGEASKATLALEVRGYGKAFGERVLFRDAGFTVLNGERVALVGPNGSGKTSFVRELMEFGSWERPGLRVGPSMRLGYCAQDQGVFDPEKTVEEVFLPWLATRQEVYGHLSTFLFSYGDLDKRCAKLSGGELNRLQLARASAMKANFLVLDEPTNHLDIPTREAVEDAILDFEGTVLVISHDRYFLEKLADRVVFIDDGRFVEYEGSFAEYWRDVGRGAGALRSSVGKGVRLEDRARSRVAAAGAGESRDRGAVALEAEISAMERRKEELEKAIADAIEERRFGESKRLAGELEKHAKLLAAQWERYGRAVDT